MLTLNDEQGHVRCLTAQPVVARQDRKRRQGLIKVMSDSDHSILTSYEHTHTHTLILQTFTDEMDRHTLAAQS